VNVFVKNNFFFKNVKVKGEKQKNKKEFKSVFDEETILQMNEFEV